MSNKLVLHAYAAEKLEKYKQDLVKKGITTSPNSNIFVAIGNNPYNKGKGDKLSTLEGIFVEASIGAWHNLEQKRFSAQDFRDVLQSALENANVHPKIAAPLLGYKVKGVAKHYSNHDFGEFCLHIRVLCLVLNREATERIGRYEKAVSPIYFNT